MNHDTDLWLWESVMRCVWWRLGKSEGVGGWVGGEVGGEGGVGVPSHGAQQGQPTVRLIWANWSRLEWAEEGQTRLIRANYFLRYFS